MKTPYILGLSILFTLILNATAAQQLIQGYGLKVMSTPYHAISTDPQGNVFVYYYFDLVNGEYMGSLAKIDQHGQLAENFNKVYTDGVVGDVQVQTDGKILMSGGYSQVNGQPSSDLVRLNSDGSIDLSFSAAIQEVGDFELQSDGKIVAFASSEQFKRSVTLSSRVMEKLWLLHHRAWSDSIRMEVSMKRSRTRP